MKELPEDISKKMAKDFGSNNAEATNVLKMFMSDYPDESARICRCAIYLAKGDLNGLLDALSLARKDFRDLIVEAEYENWPDKPVQVRDFNQPFS